MRRCPDGCARAQGGHLIRAALVVLSTTLFLPLAMARSAPTDPILYTGAFRAMQLDLGAAPAFATDEPALGLSVRAATVLSLLDGELRYAMRMADAHRLHRLGTTLHLHPLALTALLNHQWGRWLSAASAHLGGGLALAEGEDSGAVGAWWSYGGALDIPLTNPDHGSAVWVGLLYENSRFTAAIEEKNVASVSLRLAYRANGI